MFRFSFRRFAFPFVTPMRTAHGVWREREGIWVRLENEAGDVGLGEAVPIPTFGTETMDSLEARCRALSDRVDAEEIEAVSSEWPCLQFALKSALSEVVNKLQLRDGKTDAAQPQTKNEPISGGVTSGRGSTYLPIAALLPAGKSSLERVGPLSDSGFRTFKWKVGVRDLEDEIGTAEDLLSRLPAGAKLRLDANGAWNHRQAQKWLERAADWPIEFIEQPVAPDAQGFDDTMLGLAGDYPTPLALDESIATGEQVAHWLDLGWRGFFVIKPALLGNAEETLARIRKGTTRVVFSSALETAIGARAVLRLALEQGEPGRAIGFGVWPLFEDARLNGPALAPFIRREDVERLDPAAAWNV